jgi:hypothetical protein
VGGDPISSGVEYSAATSVMGLFGAFIDANRAYSAVSREEIEPWLPEIREWLRERDSFMSHQAGTAALPALTPITRRASLVPRSNRKAM